MREGRSQRDGGLKLKEWRPCALLTSEQCEPGQTFEAWSCLQCIRHLGSSRRALTRAEDMMPCASLCLKGSGFLRGSVAGRVEAKSPSSPESSTYYREPVQVT